MAGALNPRRPPAIRTRFRSPDPDGPPVSPLFEGVSIAEMSPSQETSVTSSTTFDGVAPRSAHALMRMAVVGRRGFSLNDKAVDAPARDRR